MENLELAIRDIVEELKRLNKTMENLHEMSCRINGNIGGIAESIEDLRTNKS